jgi:hypothetical protein
MSDDNNKKDDKKKALERSRRMLNEMGIDPEQMERESQHELMVPKMALVGIFDTVQKFCDAGKNTIMGSVGALNIRAIKVFLSALRGSLDMADKVISEYEQTQARVAARETISALSKVMRAEKATDTRPIGERDTDPAPGPEDDALEDDEEDPSGEEVDVPDDDDTSGFGGSFSKFKKSGKLVN